MYDHDTVEQLYSDEDYAKNPFFRHGDTPTEQSDNRRLSHYNKALDYVESQSKIGRLLDVGCGNGAFL